jgi:long-subunit acyl-CoA synthetase (AMP-forming)
MTAFESLPGNTAHDLSGEQQSPIDWRSGPPLPNLRPTTVPELIVDCLRRFPTAPVVSDGNRTATWSDLNAWSAQVAAAWSAHLPVGGRCAILVGNGLVHLVAELACWRLGAVAVPVFLGFGAQRIAELLMRVEPQVAVVDDPQIAHAVPVNVVKQSSDDLWSASSGQHQSKDRAVKSDDPCVIQFTSGSTGVPRGVILTHDNLASQQAAFGLHWPEIGPGDRLAAYLPWHHSFGGLAERLWSLCRGAHLTVVPGGGRDRQRLITTIREVAPTVFFSVPKIHALAAAENLFVRGGSLRWAFTAGAPMPDDLRQWYAQRDIPICEGWGLTETSPSCTLTSPGIGREGVVGWPIAGVTVGVRQSDGRILVRGPNVMAGYFRQPTPTLCDGVLDTGDIGAWSEDGLRLRGRADHQLKLGNGEKVCAAALEAALHTHPAILHAVVAAEPELIAVIEAQTGHASPEIWAAIDAVNAEQTVPYQRITALYIMHQHMSVENSMLTASLKVSRGQVLAAFRRWRCDGGPAFVRYESNAN